MLEWLQCLKTLALSPLLHPLNNNDPCSGQYKPHMPSHGECSFAHGHHAADELGDLLQRQPRPPLHESRSSEVQLTGLCSCYPLQEIDTQ